MRRFKVIKILCIFYTLLIFSGCSKENSSDKLVVTNNKTVGIDVSNNETTETVASNNVTINPETIDNKEDIPDYNEMNSGEITPPIQSEDNISDPTLLLKVNNSYDSDDSLVDNIEGDGPSGFYVADNGMIYICDALKKGILIYDKNGAFYQRINLDEKLKLMDMYVDEESSTIYVLAFRSLLKMDFSGNLIKEDQIPNIESDRGDLIYPQTINKIADDIILYYTDGKIYSMSKKEMVDTVYLDYVAGTDNKKAYIEDVTTSDRVYFEALGEAVTTKILNVNKEGLIYLYVYSRDLNTKEQFFNEVVVLDDNKNIMEHYKCLYYDNFFHQRNKLKINDDHIYQMVINMEGLCIYRLN